MKKILSLALAAILTLSANAKVVKTSQFSSVKVNAPVHLVIVPGRSYSVNVMSRDPELASAVSWRIRDGVLSLSSRDVESLERSRNKVEVIVTTPNAIDYQVGKEMKQVSSSKHKLNRPRRTKHHF